MATSKRTKSTGGYRVSTWRGSPVYRCERCPASRTSEPAMLEHLAGDHGYVEAPVAKAPKGGEGE